MPRLPMVIPAADLASLASDLPPGLLDETFDQACQRLDRYIGALAWEMAAALGLEPGPQPAADALMSRRQWHEAGSLALRWLLETLTLYGLAEGDGSGWRLLQPADALPAAAALRAEAERISPASAPAYEVLARCAAALPPVLRGEQRGEDALFGPATLGLWFEYFSNANQHYAPNNVIAGTAVARAAGAGCRVLEVGGGGGSAAQAALAALAAAGVTPSEYVFTELQPAFLRRGTRAVQSALPAACRLRSLRLDINADPVAQGLAPESFDVAFGVNTLHLAHEPAAALAGLRAVLSPGGTLVLGELLRPGPNAPVHLELPFTLLEEYRHAPLIAGVRERPGFMSVAGWTRALEQAGFREVNVIPAQVERCAAIYPGFYCGALTARA